MMETVYLQGLCSIIIQGLLLILSTVNVRGGFVPVTPCQAPLQWEGRIVVYDHNTGISTRALITYDSKLQRIRTLDERRSLVPCKRVYEYIYLYKEAVMFKIEHVTQSCSKKTLTEPWDPYDIPENSTFEDHFYIGGPGDQITVQEWSDRKPARKSETWVGIYTDKDCYPVQEIYTKNGSMTASTRFFDIQLGIKDPSVFNPPDICHMAHPISLGDDC
ncbi:mammalian ependymin-related protein 1 [Spea bombifrons]|uniref:mammalian ependymin-related protein 1 n=1 Tax=Spea bombifrons TaxID=233779 RepID=UPI0023494F70|nr:mammalian ependymin-related protein 1 [Spea bombifrons]